MEKSYLLICFPLSCSANFLSYHRSTCLRMALFTVGQLPLHQLTIKKIPIDVPTGQSDRVSSSVECLSSRMCQAEQAAVSHHHLPCSQVNRNIIMKMTVLPKVIYTLICYREIKLEKKILKFTWSHKNIPDSQSNLKKKEQS